MYTNIYVYKQLQKMIIHNFYVFIALGKKYNSDVTGDGPPPKASASSSVWSLLEPDAGASARSSAASALSGLRAGGICRCRNAIATAAAVLRRGGSKEEHVALNSMSVPLAVRTCARGLHRHHHRNRIRRDRRQEVMSQAM